MEAMKTYKSIIQENMDECYICHTTQNLHLHHIYAGTANRKKSDEYNAVIRLCGKHHNMSKQGIHFNKELNLKIKQRAQIELEKEYSHEWFIQTFGKSYI